MTIRRIIYANDKRLKQKSDKVTRFDAALKQLANDMHETMQSFNGVGIAGPQIGVMQRIFVAEIPPNRDGDDEPSHPQSGQTYILVNPQIVRVAKKRVEGREGCLSIPTWFGYVERPEWVELIAQDLNGEQITLKTDDLLGRIFQHEIDHLNGVLYPEHISDPTKFWQELPSD
ncbi:peptide deformylase [Anaerolineales bacterium HSG24]|nr:peptide deformylase [Anaerolineales bacterium HSG24]